MTGAAAGGGWAEGLRLLEARVRALPDLLREGAARPDPAPGFAPADVRGVVTTGVGSSAAHARFLSHLLAQRLGLRARYVPLSAFLAPPGPGAADEALVVISQGLSPNARLALARPRAWRHVVLMTATGEEGARRAGREDRLRLLAELRAAGVEVRPFPAGEDEYGTLVRVIGPMAGYLCALRLVAALARAAGTPAAVTDDVEAVCRALATAPGRLDAALPPAALGALASGVAFLTSGTYGELVENLRYKVLEGMLLPAPPVWDLLHVAHGPFQQLYERPAVLLALARPDAPAESDLLARLERMLEPDRHHLVRLEATLPGPLAILDHEALMNALLLRDVAARGVDQVRWPGRGREDALYELGGGAAAPTIAGEPAAPTGAAGATAAAVTARGTIGPAATGGARALDRMVWPEIERLVAGGATTAVVPLGSTEQHGPHLPLATDTWIAEALAERFCARVPEAIRLPALALGCAPEHLAFPGTLSLRPETLGALLVDLARSLRTHGFARAFVFSAHGGNDAALRAAVPAVRAAAAPMAVIAFTDRAAVTAAVARASAALGVPPGATGLHAGESETSIVLALRPEAVRVEALAPGVTGPVPDPRALFYPSLRPHAPRGTVGDPRPASAARAACYLDAWVALLVEAYRREKKRA
jgi:creatinine amidohydrolase/Fe(II)-dependent formamide hydrolase-like protein